MKTKLLKRLRKEAKNKFIIKRNHDGYHVCERVDAGYFYYFYFTNLSCKNMEDVKNACNAVRRKYILNKVRLLRRNKYEEILDF